ncbi:NADH:flavin oxidoreductase [Actinobacillus equuli]|nr:NADH:flavin oxidoreductase [Actinobacillus equuli]
MLNPNLVELIQTGREAEIESTFDWEKADYYRYTPAMLQGTMAGTDFFPPSKQNSVRYRTNHFKGRNAVADLIGIIGSLLCGIIKQRNRKIANSLRNDVLRLFLFGLRKRVKDYKRWNFEKNLQIFDHTLGKECRLKVVLRRYFIYKLSNSFSVSI